MSRKFYFVLSYDEHDNKWEIDIDKEEEAFPLGTVYDNRLEEWHSEGYLYHTNQKWYHDSNNLNSAVIKALEGVKP